jgi:O-antigen/teichoic acid export membrane protein
MLVSLYTVRVALNTLGAKDYGLYNVVMGIMAILGVLNTSMLASSQRFFSFEIGKNNAENLQELFTTIMSLYILIALVILLLSETIGLWCVSVKLNVPFERKTAVLWVYQFTILLTLITTLTSPYIALVIANEDMNIYALASIIETVLKLIFVYFLQFIAFDKLLSYSIFMCLVAFMNIAVYKIVYIIKYKEIKYSFHLNKRMFREIIKYNGWNIFSDLSGNVKWQGTTILLNQIFNEIIVAARSISLSVNSAVTKFTNNTNTALRPQIIKNYATNNFKEFIKLVYRGVKLNFFLFYVLALPLVLEMPYILVLWLKEVPDMTVIFSRFTLVDSIIYFMTLPLYAIGEASGKIKPFRLSMGILYLSILPISFILVMVFNFPAYSVSIVGLVSTVVTFVIYLFIIRRICNFSIASFIKKIVLPILITGMISAILPIGVLYFFEEGMLRLFFLICISTISMLFCSYVVLLDNIERIGVWNIANKYYNKLLTIAFKEKK